MGNATILNEFPFVLETLQAYLLSQEALESIFSVVKGVRVDEDNSREFDPQLHLKMDHLCWECPTTEEYERMRKNIEYHSLFIFQSVLNQRRITVAKLHHPVPTFFGPLSLIKLTEQASDHIQPSGNGYIELVPVHDAPWKIIHAMKERKDESFYKHPTEKSFIKDLADSFQIRISATKLLITVAQQIAVS